MSTAMYELNKMVHPKLCIKIDIEGLPCSLMIGRRVTTVTNAKQLKIQKQGIILLMSVPKPNN